MSVSTQPPTTQFDLISFEQLGIKRDLSNIFDERLLASKGLRFVRSNERDALAEEIQRLQQERLYTITWGQVDESATYYVRQCFPKDSAQFWNYMAASEIDWSIPLILAKVNS